MPPPTTETTIYWRCTVCEARKYYSPIRFPQDPLLSEVLKQIRDQHAQESPDCYLTKMRVEMTDISFLVRGIQ